MEGSTSIIFFYFLQGVKVGTFGRLNERNSSYVRLAHTSIFGLCFMPVCLIKSNCYSLIYSSLMDIVAVVFFPLWKLLLCGNDIWFLKFLLKAFLFRTIDVFLCNTFYTVIKTIFIATESKCLLSLWGLTPPLESYQNIFYSVGY